MIKITLSGEERNRLKSARKRRDANISERYLYVLLSDEGKSVPEIARHTKRNGHTIRFWLMAYQKDGLEGLKETLPPGRPPVKSLEIYPLILEIVPKSPIEYGYIEDGWTIPMIIDYLKDRALM